MKSEDFWKLFGMILAALGLVLFVKGVCSCNNGSHPDGAGIALAGMVAIILGTFSCRNSNLL